MTNDSVLTKHQVKTFGPVKFSRDGRNYQITAEVRYDDDCSNGHNSFAITSDIQLCDSKGNPVRMDSCGQQHEEVAKYFPGLAPFLKWHLTDSVGPMHYVANTLYWLGYCGYVDGKAGSPPNLEYARSCAVWPDMPESYVAGTDATLNADRKIKITKELTDRLPELLKEFRAAVEFLGFTY